MRHFATAALCTLLLAGCSQPTDTVIPSDPKEWDTKLAGISQKLNEADREVFAAYMARHMLANAFGGQGAPTITPGTTVGEALKQQRAWQEEQDRKKAAEEAARKEAEAKAAALKAEAEAKAAAARKEIEAAATVALVEKKFQPANYNAGQFLPTQRFKIVAKNTGEKTIAGISGSIVFIDLFGKDVGSVSFEMTETIAPGASHTWRGERTYQDFIDTHKAVRDLDEGKYTTRFEPRTLVFTDGSRLALEGPGT